MTAPKDTVVAPSVVTNPARLRGRPTIQGTRITVERVLGMLAHGCSFDDIRESYPHLTRDQIADAVRYAQGLVIAQTPGIPGETDPEPRDWERDGEWTTAEVGE